MTYLGRLDPMAEGVLLILAGVHTSTDRERYLGLDKAYEAEILLGFSSDTYDTLGLAKKDALVRIDAEDVNCVLNNFRGRVVLPLPIFSSVPYKSTPLFVSARAGNLKVGDAPVREMSFIKVRLLGLKKTKADTLLKAIIKGIKKVEGDFRQDQIIKQWKKILSNDTKSYQLLKLQIHCSSGTYIRSVASELGKALGSGGLLFRLKRVKVGRFKIEKSKKII